MTERPNQFMISTLGYVLYLDMMGEKIYPINVVMMAPIVEIIPSGSVYPPLKQ